MSSPDEKTQGVEDAIPGYDSSKHTQGVIVGLDQPADFSEVQDMKQGLKSRHLQMLALAGAIGTGLFLGSGRAVANAGPIGALLGYTLTGLIAAGVVLPVAEMGALVPLSGGVVRYAEIFVDPALSFANGWNLVYKGLIFIPTELVAAAVLVQYWSDINSAVWITLFGILMSLSNFLFIKVFGELEFGFALLKIALIVIINVMSLVIICGGGPNGDVIGFKYWKNPGPFAQEYLGFTGSLGRFLGFYTVFANALYAYSGIENISLAAAETKNARRVIPQAAKRVFWRILIFYILTIFLVGLVIPSDNDMLFQSKGAAASPFVISAQIAGIKVIPHVINAIVITSAWSCGNMGMMSYIRYLFGLAKNGHAPKVFLRINRFGIPWVAATLFTVFMALGYLATSNGAAQVFTWLQDLLSTAILVNWSVILITFLRFYYGCRKQCISRKELPYQSPFQPYYAWASLLMCILLLVTGGWRTFLKGRWDTQAFVSAYFNVPFVLVLYLGYKHIKKTKIIPLDQIPIRPLLEIAHADPSPPLKSKKGWRKLNILW
ncbi:related to general amino acid permease [Fusarium torulosum]|uniref:Related to general amino acid permease n=1 Tax=Fusarium torulosum TaxID=33205 RepID=A0AAE8SQ56_9HYPO|nr:related to general amino acid permease [Fusarium torulosum]